MFPEIDEDYEAGVFQGFMFGVKVMTHLQNDVLAMADLLAELADGEITISTSAAEMFAGFPDIQIPDEFKKGVEMSHSNMIPLYKRLAGIIRNEMGGDLFDSLRSK